jgi:predicted O-methyltransferase YrrM
VKNINIREKLIELGSPVETFLLGDFDAIGEYTAKKGRTRDSQLYGSVGCFFRPNYERGLLAAAMVKRYKPKRILEIGFGRGYWTLCAAKAMVENGIEGEIVTVDPKFDQQHIKLIETLFPREWLERINMAQGQSADIIPQIEGHFDLVYIDGDHTYNGVRSDWNLIKDRFDQFVIFDDYYMSPSATARDVAVARAVDEIPSSYEREFIVMDRMLFMDDRGDVDKDYGQVVLRKHDFIEPVDEYAHNW